jgi:superfamily I DNA/RNA helicase
VLAELDKACRKGKTLQQFVDNCTLAGDRDDDDIEKKQGVTLITLHAAKGLEFPVVYLVGLEQGILPHKRSIDTGTTDEERRLLYVGITRAQQRLTLTYCSTRVKWGETMACTPSRFLEELDDTFLEQTSYDETMGAPVDGEELASMFRSLRETLADDE